MKVMVCTKQGQGKRKSDFCWTEEGEYAYLGMVCDRDETVDGGCGCQRSFCGMKTHKASTTARVVEDNIKTVDLGLKFKECMEKAGWRLDQDYIQQEATEMLRIANTFPVGSIIEKRGQKIQIRKP